MLEIDKTNIRYDLDELRTILLLYYSCIRKMLNACSALGMSEWCDFRWMNNDNDHVPRLG